MCRASSSGAKGQTALRKQAVNDILAFRCSGMSVTGDSTGVRGVRTRVGATTTSCAPTKTPYRYWGFPSTMTGMSQHIIGFSSLVSELQGVFAELVATTCCLKLRRLRILKG